MNVAKFSQKLVPFFMETYASSSQKVVLLDGTSMLHMNAMTMHHVFGSPHFLNTDTKKFSVSKAKKKLQSRYVSPRAIFKLLDVDVVAKEKAVVKVKESEGSEAVVNKTRSSKYGNWGLLKKNLLLDAYKDRGDKFLLIFVIG